VAAVAEPSSDDIQAGSGPANPALPTVPPHVGRDLALYVLARFALVAVIAVILTLINVPLLISVAVGLVVGVPLSMVVLRGWHERVAAGLAARGMVRRAARDALRAELRGDSRSGTASPDAG
jgi:Protein of unknown function (DUF4229)